MVSFKQQLSQRLGEDISSLICKGDMINTDFSSFFSIMNKVIPYVDVFHFIMILQIVDKLLSTLIVD